LKKNVPNLKHTHADVFAFIIKTLEGITAPDGTPIYNVSSSVRTTNMLAEFTNTDLDSTSSGSRQP
jgi:hypothetical protein